ncbi:hypothetical protein DFH11DRAFT_1685957 [Phellopilus nigrolimitatus]|nr:hypothetical protein DFH11DRAFT_1685957 [Phellopilus nigrolimitatus]
MSFQQFNGYGGQARRDHKENRVVVYVSPQQPVPDMVPYELHDHIFPDEWHMRITAIRDMSFRYYKPLFERIWFMVATLVVIVFPLLLYRIVFDAIYENGPQTPETFFEARAVSIAIFIATILLFWAPMLIWKGIGKMRVRSLLSGWERTDRMNKGPSAFIPIWMVKHPTVFKSTCIVTITTPPNAHPTLFHPNAYLPSFINPPNDAGAAYYYPYAPGQVGLPRMSTVGDLPAYKASSGTGKTFEDVKV